MFASHKRSMIFICSRLTVFSQQRFTAQRPTGFYMKLKCNFTCAKPAFSKAHGIDNKADPMIVFQIDKMVVNDEFFVPEAIAIAEPLMLSDLKKYI